MKRFNTKVFFILVISMLMTGCYQLFQSKIPMTHQKPGVSLGDILIDEVKTTKLEAPVQIFVSEGLSPNTIRISWSQVDKAASYCLERAVIPSSENFDVDNLEFNAIQASGTGIITSTFISGTEYSDLITSTPSYTSDEYNQNYIYRVCAENKQMGYESSDFTYSGKAFLFAPPVNVSASAGENSDRVEIKWEPSKKAIRYRIYRSGDSTNSNPVLLKEVSGDVRKYTNLISTNEQGIDFYYSVKAVNSLGVESVSSSVALGFALKEGAPGRISDVKITEGKGRGDGPASDGIEITWKPQDGLMYTVYRSSSKDNSLQQLATGLTDCKYLDKKSLKPNTYYYYRVLGYKTMGSGDSAEIVKGPLSQSGPEDDTPAEGFILSAPEEIAIDRLGTRFQIKFSQPIGEDGYLQDSKIYTESYKIYSYLLKGGTTLDSIEDDIPFTEVFPVDGYYTITIETQCKFFKIITQNGSSISLPSSVTAPSPTASQNVQATKAAFIKEAMSVTKEDGKHNMLVTGANVNEVFPVKITWNAPADGADGGYFIYRSTDPEKGYRKITENPVTECSYIDYNDTAKAGIYYYYKVLSLNQLGKGSNYSDYATGYGAITYNQFMREYNKTIQRSQKKLTLMHKSGNTDKLGTETINGDISGDLYYKASVQGLGGKVIMKYTDYADYYVPGTNNVYFRIDGNTNTSASMDASGTMDGTVVCSDEGMYPGTLIYDNVEIKGGSAGGGYYLITPKGFPEGEVDYTVGNEGW